MPTWISDWWKRVRGREDAPDPITDAVRALHEADDKLERAQEQLRQMQDTSRDIQIREVQNHFGESIKYVWGLS